jgi:inosose dehydratase
MTTRRKFIKNTSITAAAVTLYAPNFLHAEANADLRISCQQYPWFTFFKREGKEWSKDLGYSMSEYAKVGFDGFEPSFETPEEVDQLSPLLRKHQLSSKSLYVNSVLHDTAQTEQSIAAVMAIASVAKKLGVEILVTNPSPISWGGEEDKTDQQIMIQAKALDDLGRQLKEIGVTLAYHNHDAEMRNSAREFHHMMMATEPSHVSLCLDAHWIYRGSGNSQVALFDIVEQYKQRIVELHLRQSRGGIWTEEFAEGDIDYLRLVKILKEGQIRPHIVLEQSIEAGSPNTMDAVKAHQLGLEYCQELFV